MKARTTITVKEWFFDKLADTMATYHCTPVRTYIVDESGLEHAAHDKLRINAILSESEKAYKVEIDAETNFGHTKAWNAWIPKSVVIAD